jgi:hypothetical protein
MRHDRQRYRIMNANMRGRLPDNAFPLDFAGRDKKSVRAGKTNHIDTAGLQSPPNAAVQVCTGLMQASVSAGLRDAKFLFSSQLSLSSSQHCTLLTGRQSLANFTLGPWNSAHFLPFL